MGLFDTLRASIGQFAEAEAGPLLGPALQAAGFGNLQGVVDQLRAAGLDQQVKAWASGQSAQPISAEELKAVISSQQVQQLAQHFGVNPDMALNILAHHLPQAVADGGQSGQIATSN